MYTETEALSLFDHLNSGAHTTSGSRPAPAAHTKINRASLLRVASLWAAGVPDSRGRRSPVIGDPRWTGDDAPDLPPLPAVLPHSVTLSDDLLGHVETHAGFKIAFRLCAATDCDNEFTVRRGARSSARWPDGCSAACKHTIRMQRQRERRARERGNPD